MQAKTPMKTMDENPCCEVCQRLTAALRNSELQRRNAVDQRNVDAALPLQIPEDRVAREKLFIAEMNALDRNRNAALEALAEHQVLKHQ